MFFRVLGIKEISGRNYNLDFLIQYESENSLRGFCSTIGIVVLRVEEFKGLETNFGTTKLIVEEHNESKTQRMIILKSTDYRKSYLLYSLIGFTVSGIESLDPAHPVDQESMQKNIVEWDIQLEKLAQINSTKKKEVHQHNFDIEDHKITEMQLLSSQVIQRSKVVQNTMADEMSIQERKNLEKLTQELSKVKLGTNMEKMKTYANEIIILINDVEKRQISRLTDFQQSIFQGSAVTNVDVVKEIQRYEKAENIKKFGGEKTANDKFYISFGKIGVYLKFLWKDFLHKLSKFDKVVVAIFSFLQIILFVALLIIGIYLVGISKQGGEGMTIQAILTFINLGMISILVFILGHIAKNRYMYIMIGCIIIIPVYFVIMMIFRNTFSL